MRVSAEVKQQTRRNLLDAAAEAFVEYGYAAANIDRVSEAAGLAKGTVYNYFASKRELFEAVLGEGCAHAAGAAAVVEPGDSPRLRLEAFVTANLAWRREHPAHAALLARELLSGDEGTRELILEASEPCIAKVAEILAEAQRSGELPPKPPARQLAPAFIVLANGLLIESASSGWPEPDRLAQAAAAMFLAGAVA